MKTLYVRDVPEELYEQVKALAEKDHRSIQAQALHLIEQALQQQNLQEQRRQAYESIQRRRHEKKPLSVDSLTLLREDRDR